MKNLQEKLPFLTRFNVLPSRIQVIPGKWEGIYSWIAVNYMLDRFAINSSPAVTQLQSSISSIPDRPLTAGYLLAFLSFFGESIRTSSQLDMNFWIRISRYTF